MNCETARQSIDEFRTGRLAPEDSRAVSRHLHQCPACAIYELDVERIRHRLLDLGAPPFPAAGVEKTLSRLRRSRWSPRGIAGRVIRHIATTGPNPQNPHRTAGKRRKPARPEDDAAANVIG